METSKSIDQLKLLLAIAALVLTITLVTPTQAAPTVRPIAGKTSVLLSEAFLEALIAVNITPGIIEPASLRGVKAHFPIPGGGIDVEGYLEIFHLGGLSLTDANGTTLELFNFIIDATGEETPVLTGLVTVSGDLFIRAPLFDLDLATATVKLRSDKLVITGVVLRLTEFTAFALNDLSYPGETSVFEEGFEIGVAKVLALFLDEHDDDDDGDDRKRKKKRKNDN